MAQEIERTFLVANDGWRGAVARRERLVDGLVAVSDGRKVRVRLYEDRATLTIKTRRVGAVREEFEYPIPMDDARDLLARHCGATELTKIRHVVPYEGFDWVVDEYEGMLAGVILAEIELPREDTMFPLPPWIGREVTLDPAWRKGEMVRRYVEGR
jgi:CYTH domain-containing protein